VALKRSLDVSKTVEGERRSIFFTAFAGKDEMVGGLAVRRFST